VRREEEASIAELIKIGALLRLIINSSEGGRRLRAFAQVIIICNHELQIGAVRGGGDR